MNSHGGATMSALAPTTSSSCNGDCCEAFTLPFSTSEFWRAFEAWAESKSSWTDEAGVKRGIPTDVHLVAPMIRSIGKHQVNPVGGQQYDEAVELFTCVHFDREARRCGIYEHRPQVCRSYPNGNCCKYRSCTWAEVRDNGASE